MLQHSQLQDTEASRRYLLQKAQHMIGGFGKLAGDPPGELVVIELSIHFG